MIRLAKKGNLLKYPSKPFFIDEKRKIFAFEKNKYLFLFNFHVSEGCDFSKLLTDLQDKYTKNLDLDWEIFGGKKKPSESGEAKNFVIGPRSAAVYELE